MKIRMICSCLAVILCAGGLASAKDSPDQKREKTRKMAAQTLQDLYKMQPLAEGAIQKSAGYAVFQQHGCKRSLAEHGTRCGNRGQL